MLRMFDDGASLPGVDTPVGNQTPAASLTPLSQFTQNSSAPIFYDAAINAVIVMQAGAVLKNIDFGSATLCIKASNVTVEDCTFTNTTGYTSISQVGAASGATVKNCSFTGPTHSTPLMAEFIAGGVNPITIADNSFVDAPSDAVHLTAGTVTGNYFSGGGYQTGAHPDAITVDYTTGPVSITDNFIDWTSHGAPMNDCVRITANGGSTSNVTVSGNYLLGGAYAIDAGNQAVTTSTEPAGTVNTFSNISITNNYTGFSAYGSPFFPGTQQGVTAARNVVFDFTNPALSTSAWAAYEAAGIPTANLVISTGGYINASSSGPTTLYGAGYQVFLTGGLKETNFVGGFGKQYMTGGAGANIITELAVSNSPVLSTDCVGNFDPAKDVIDLSHIDADLSTPGVQNFTFIGTAAFDGAEGEVRYQQDPANNCTWVQATLASDTTPDLEIRLSGLQTLTAANFALTAAQSSKDLAAGAALSIATTRVTGWTEYSYSNVTGRNYASFEAFAANGQTQADELNLSASADQLNLNQNKLTVTRGSATETLQVGTTPISLGYHANETMIDNGSGSETFTMLQNFGNETISGFTLSGSNPDTLNLSLASFSYLSSGMTQSQDLAAVLAHATSSTPGITITDSQNNSLTLTGLTAASITANPSQFNFRA